MDRNVKEYLATIGRKGGRVSKRRLSAADAKAMVNVREARRAFKKYYFLCFWYMRPDLKITKSNMHLVIKGLKNYGNRETFLVASRLCS